jgi:hypothetical protein
MRSGAVGPHGHHGHDAVVHAARAFAFASDHARVTQTLVEGATARKNNAQIVNVI